MGIPIVNLKDVVFVAKSDIDCVQEVWYIFRNPIASHKMGYS